MTVTGATGLIGPRVIGALQAGGARGHVLSRDRERAAKRLADAGSAGARRSTWDPMSEPAPAAGAGGPRRGRAPRGREHRPALERRRQARDPREPRDGHAQPARRAASRPSARPAALVSSSAIGYYGAHGEEPLDEEAPPGSDFLARVCVEWEAEASQGARRSACAWRSCARASCWTARRRAGEDAAAVSPRRRRPGRRRAPVHLLDPPRRPRRDDRGGASRDERWSGPSTRPRPSPSATATSRARSAERCKRPALAARAGRRAARCSTARWPRSSPTGARVVPAKPLVLGYEFAHAELAEALARARASSPASPIAPPRRAVLRPRERRAARLSVSMITRHGRRLSR